MSEPQGVESEEKAPEADVPPDITVSGGMALPPMGVRFA